MVAGSKIGIVLFSLLILGALALSAQAEFRDFGTQRSGMHACLKPGFMTGVHIDRNVLLCDDTVVNDAQFEASEEEIDENTQQWSMHACPSEMAMTGYDRRNNRLLCAKVGPTRDFPDVNGVTQRTIGNIRMHACPIGMGVCVAMERKPGMFL